MHSVQRSKGIRRLIRSVVLREPVQRYVTAGSRACGTALPETRSRKPLSGPSDQAILAWAEFDLTREIIDGFWEPGAA
jgi:hypothetical protein